MLYCLERKMIESYTVDKLMLIWYTFYILFDFNNILIFGSHTNGLQTFFLFISKRMLCKYWLRTFCFVVGWRLYCAQTQEPLLQNSYVKDQINLLDVGWMNDWVTSFPIKLSLYLIVPCSSAELALLEGIRNLLLFHCARIVEAQIKYDEINCIM